MTRLRVEVIHTFGNIGYMVQAFLVSFIKRNVYLFLFSLLFLVALVHSIRGSCGVYKAPYCQWLVGEFAHLFFHFILIGYLWVGCPVIGDPLSSVRK
jgi:hypothetical protein